MTRSPAPDRSTPNRLAAATSPYLLQHKDNPVDWREWGPEALAEARARDCPILLSVGYAACHWCHVMAHESFENDAIAAQMNQHFVNIKVDREERPDLDQIYQHALALMAQQGGWPLTMFLTPEGEPFWGGTYFPPERRHGRPGFPEVLESIDRIWRTEREKVRENTSVMVPALRALATPSRGHLPSADLAIHVAKRAAQSFDTIHGGLGGAPKFPQAPILGLLWHAAHASGDRTLRIRVCHTLERISQGGIYDHVGGGYARYAVDAYWLVPHFEKMLYDNALLLGLLADVGSDMGDPLFEVRARETVGWLEREMRIGGGFASSLDADSEGEEGRFYVFESAEVDRLLGDHAEAFRLAFGVTDGGNFEGKTVLNRLHEKGLRPSAEEADLRRALDVLLQARATRVRPGRDDKVLADWNGLLIRSLVQAALAFAEPAWLDLARAAFAFIQEELGSESGGAGPHLVHAWRDGRRLEMAFVDDYAAMAGAALALYEATAEPAYLEAARGWVRAAEASHLDPAGGGFFQSAEGSDSLVRPKSAHDGPVPSGNALMVDVLVRLFCLTGETAYRTRAEDTLTAFAGEVGRNPLAHAALLTSAAFFERPLQIVLCGTADDPGAHVLHRTALSLPASARVIQLVRPGTNLPAGHPAQGKTAVAGRPTAYVCLGETCRLPVTDPAELQHALRT